ADTAAPAKDYGGAVREVLGHWGSPPSSALRPPDGGAFAPGLRATRSGAPAVVNMRIFFRKGLREYSGAVRPAGVDRGGLRRIRGNPSGSRKSKPLRGAGRRRGLGQAPKRPPMWRKS